MRRRPLSPCCPRQEPKWRMYDRESFAMTMMLSKCRMIRRGLTVDCLLVCEPADRVLAAAPPASSAAAERKDQTNERLPTCANLSCEKTLLLRSHHAPARANGELLFHVFVLACLDVKLDLGLPPTPPPTVFRTHQPLATQRKKIAAPIPAKRPTNLLPPANMKIIGRRIDAALLSSASAVASKRITPS